MDRRGVQTRETPPRRSRSVNIPYTVETDFVLERGAGRAGRRRVEAARASTSNISNNNNNQNQNQNHHQGVLWKRRDIFKNRWRPRWFVLQPGPGILTYYILTGDAIVPDTVVTSANSSTTPTNNNNNNNRDDNNLSRNFWNNTMISNVDLLTSSSSSSPNRNRTSSWDSRASENTIDYDVVPRGTIYLLGCTCKANPALTRPEESLYCLTIYPPSLTETQIHLAARSEEIRDRWVQKIAAVCHHPAQTPEEQVPVQVPVQPETTTTTTTEIATATTTAAASSFSFLQPPPQQDLQPPSQQQLPPSSQQQQQQQPSQQQQQQLHREVVIRPRTIPEHGLLPTPPTTPSHSPSRSTDPLAAASSIERTTTQMQEQQQQQSSSSSLNSFFSLDDSLAWKSLGSPTQVYNNLSDSLATRIQQSLKAGLDMVVEEETNAEQGNENDINDDPAAAAAASHMNDKTPWKLLYRKENAVAYRRRPATMTTSPPPTTAAAAALSAFTSATRPVEEPPMIKIDARLNFPLLQVFELLVDSRRRGDYHQYNYYPTTQDEQGRQRDSGTAGIAGTGVSLGRVRESRRLQQINPHTFLDYYAYSTIWPASPREFAVVTHWQVLERPRRSNKNTERKAKQEQQRQEEEEVLDGNDDRGHSFDSSDENNNNIDDDNTEKAIVIVSFSCPEADEAVEKTSSPMGHIRGKVHQSLILLRENTDDGNNNNNDQNSCHLTKILSMELGGGGVTSHFLNVTLNQHANLPLHLNNYLRQYERIPEPRHHSNKGLLLTNEHVIREIINRLDETLEVSVKRRKTMKRDSSIILPSSSSSDDYDLSEDNNDDYNLVRKEFVLPPLEHQARLLLAPLLLYQLAAFAKAPSPSLWFVISLFFSIRQLVILYIGGEKFEGKYRHYVRGATQELLVGPVTCRFRVDLKGVLRFIANKKEEREELKRGTAEITVSHIVACAVASALKKEEKLCMKRVSIPYLFIDRLVSRGSEPVSVTFLSDTGSGGSQVITLQNVDSHNVQRVADDMKHAAENEDSHDGTVGTCLIIATPNCDQVEMETDVLPRHPNVSVVCTIGGVHLERNYNTRASTSPMRRSQGPRPVLSLSLTVANRSPTDFIACRRFAEDVQTLLQFPEMCDD